EQRQRELEQKPAAQQAAPPPPAPAKPLGGIAKADDGGFALRSSDGAFVLILRGYMQADGRFYLATTPPAVNTFLLRNIRPIVQGTVFQWFNFKLMPDFGNGTAAIFDAWVDFRP